MISPQIMAIFLHTMMKQFQATLTYLSITPSCSPLVLFFSPHSAPPLRSHPMPIILLRRMERRKKDAFSSSSSLPLMQSWRDWETSSSRGMMRLVSHSLWFRVSS